MELLEYEITVGNKSDIAAIVQFQVDMALESEGTVLDSDKVLRGVTAAMNDSEKGTYLVARNEGETVASLMITREWSDWNAEWYWWVQSVYVKPAHRGRGLFRTMYSKVKDMATQKGVSQVRLYVDKTNLSARQVYEKVGMQECHYLMYEDVAK
ncbi:MAG: GNAT family N-acetyltransferase [Alistipes sp.]|nr:GNAT family N-acetyltransferase [Alistipes sp.]